MSDELDDPLFGDEMSVDARVAALADAPDFSDDALADRHGTTAMTPQLTINWREITDEDRPAACEELAAWVHDWLVPRYRVKANVVPDCWWEHGDYVEELSALHTAWRIAFDPADGGWGPIGWHERFALALTRAPLNSKRCAELHHDDTTRTMRAAPSTF
jgi:hypothetical protein